MSERLSSNKEMQSSIPEHQKIEHENLHSNEKAQTEVRHEHVEHIEHIRADIEHQATKAEHAQEQLQPNEQQPVHHHYATKKIKSEQYQKTLKNVRLSLPKNQQKFSAFVHQPAIERVSEVGAKTIARPSGIIGGAVLALIGSAIVIFIGRHIGFEIPNSIFGILFVFGFLIGISIELIVVTINSLRPKHRRRKELYR